MILQKSFKYSDLLLKIHLLLLLLCWKQRSRFFFRFLWWIESSEEQHLSEIEIFCNIINVFIIIFDQFKASLLNKSINFYNFFPKKQKIYTDSNLLNGILYNVTKAFLFPINADLWIFLFIKETVLNIDNNNNNNNNKCFLSSKSAY